MGPLTPRLLILVGKALMFAELALTLPELLHPILQILRGHVNQITRRTRVHSRIVRTRVHSQIVRTGVHSQIVRTVRNGRHQGRPTERSMRCTLMRIRLLGCIGVGSQDFHHYLGIIGDFAGSVCIFFAVAVFH